MNQCKNADIGLLDTASCLAVHTQRAKVTLDLVNWSGREDMSMPERSYCLIRNRYRQLIGFMNLNKYAAESPRNVPEMDLVTLSVCAPV
jgi:hypothetical protein